MRVVPWWAPGALALVAVPLMRPNLFGETLSPVALGLMLVALVLRGLRRDPPTGRWFGVPLLLCLGLAYLWLLLRSAIVDPDQEAEVVITGSVLTLAPLVILVELCRDPRTRMLIGRGFVIGMLVLCGSYAITALIWAVSGVGAGEIGMFPVGQLDPQPVYAPFTITAATQDVLGVTFPRFTGLGREPGWMAMFCGITWFLAGATGIRRGWRWLLLFGLLGTVSTAGFGTFVVALAYDRFLRGRGDGITMAGYLRHIGGLVMVPLALWLATAAPVLGFSAKSSQNAVSLDERSMMTENGLRALRENPVGSPAAIGGVNLVSDIAVSGLPFVLLVCLGLLLSTARISGGGPAAGPVVVTTLATMLLSQPARDSPWAFALVLLAAGIGSTAALSPTTHDRDRTTAPDPPRPAGLPGSRTTVEGRL